MLYLLPLLLPAPPASILVPTVEDSVVREWLVIAPVDRRGRRPFRPDAVFAKHLLEPDAGPPLAGETSTGERSQERGWEAREADEKGNLGGGRIGYAYGRLEHSGRELRLARLQGASTLYVNGRPYAGDVYRFGFGGVPVVLEEGLNHIFVTGVRGSFQLTFREWPEGLYHGSWDDTVPHLVAGEAPRGALGIQLGNMSEEPSGPFRIRYSLRSPGGRDLLLQGTVRSHGLAPLGVDQFALPLEGPRLPEDAGERYPVEVRVESGDGELLLELSRELDVRAAGAKVQRTYVSGVDGSVQRYALVPPAAPADGEQVGDMRLALSLHGASVTAWRQAACYRQRPDFWVVAAENRRSFGFDWQDWGRRDAYDVLALALAESGVDRRRVYVTGHSMGGHGTWHLAANDQDGFAVCAPSAGWESFDSYGGRPEGALAEVWQAADGTSKTLELIGNRKQTPVYVLHGTKDDNVPASEALTMIEALTEANGTFDVHFQGGAGHWWGDQCVDWPPIFETFREHELPADPASVDFTSVAPQVDSRHHWLRVEQPARYGQKLRVHGGWNAEEESVTLTTENVALMAVDRPARSVVLDGQELTPAGADAPHWFRRAGETWSAVERGPGTDEKRAARSGNLKWAFDRRFLLVVGTGGDEAADDALLARARFDAGVWRYRGNGRAELWTDAEFLEREAETVGRNVILYGNRDTNAAWEALLAEDCPVSVRDGLVELGSGEGARRFEGDDLACAFLRPRLGDPDALVGVFADAGTRATRLGSTLAPFVSGVGYPDYAVYGAEVLARGDGGVLEAGWFDARWELGPAPERGQ